MFEETTALLHEAARVFAANDDAHEVYETSRIQNETLALREQRELEMKQAIREWTAKVKTAEAEIVPALSDSQHMEALQSMENEKFGLAKSINHTEHHCASLDRTVQKLQAELEALKVKRRELDQDVNVELPRSKNAITLFINLTNIKWDYEADELVKGHVSLPNSDIRPFQLDPKKSSSYFITNYLWDLL